MEASEQDLLATQKALEDEVQNRVKEAVMDNFLRVSSSIDIDANHSRCGSPLESSRKN
jgi:hypothetical protein